MRLAWWFKLALLLLLVGVPTLVACGARKQSKAPPRPSGSVSKGAMRIDANTPLIVDWKPEAEASLEKAMRDGLAILHYDESDLSLLAGCKTEGTYAFAAMRSDRSMQLTTTEEIKTALPTLGAVIASKMTTDLSRGGTIDVAMVIVGQLKGSRSSVRRAELSGDCKHATHFVRRATIGGYVLRTGTKGTVLHASEMMGARGAAPGHNFLQGIGSIESCRGTTIDRAVPPPECHAVLQLDVDRLED